MDSSMFVIESIDLHALAAMFFMMSHEKTARRRLGA
jgi:hypothetical protein